MKEKNILDKLADKVKDLRKMNDFSQEKLAEKSGLSPTYIGNIERAEQNPTLTTLEKIAKAFNITVEELLSFPDDKKIVNAKAGDINKAIELLKNTLDIALRYKH